MTISLSERLKQVAEFVPVKSRLLDVGSDHAYLPIYLATNHQITYAIAGEVVQGPFESARVNVTSYGLNHLIETRLASGLEAFTLSDEINIITICGMGGRLIVDILNQGLEKLDSISRLILQPNNRSDELRKWLITHDFSIVAERILMENQKIYEILVVEHGRQILSDKEIQFGPYLMQEKSTVFQVKWQKELEKLDYALSQIPEHHINDRRDLVVKKQIIKEVLDED